MHGPLGDADPELRQVAAQEFDQLGALLVEALMRAESDGPRQMLGAFTAT